LGWRRWEEDPDAVSASTRAKCERVLDAQRAIHDRHRQALRDENEKIERHWTDHPLLTPRQAAAIQIQLDIWQHLFIGSWLEHGGPNEPLHTVSPFDELDPRVMLYVNDNKAWAHLAHRRCIAVRDEIGGGVLPFDRDGCFFDEVLMALVIDWVAETYDDSVVEGSFEGVVPNERDHDWTAVSDAFDDVARWHDWEIPTMIDSPLLPALLARHHPFTWFDAPPVPPATLLVESATNPGGGSPSFAGQCWMVDGYRLHGWSPLKKIDGVVTMATGEPNSLSNSERPECVDGRVVGQFERERGRRPPAFRYASR
jgi:hypothetical protein